MAQARSARLLRGHRLLAGALEVLVGLVSLAVDPVHRRGSLKAVCEQANSSVTPKNTLRNSTDVAAFVAVCEGG